MSIFHGPAFELSRLLIEKRELLKEWERQQLIDAALRGAVEHLPAQPEPRATRVKRATPKPAGKQRDSLWNRVLAARGTAAKGGSK